MRQVTIEDINNIYNKTACKDLDDFFYRFILPEIIRNTIDYDEYTFCFLTDSDDDLVKEIKTPITYKELFEYLKNLGFKVVKSTEIDPYYKKYTNDIYWRS